jgi:hypothetical protein
VEDNPSSLSTKFDIIWANGNSELVGKFLIWPSKQIVFFVDWESKMAATEGQSCDIVPYGGNI